MNHYDDRETYNSGSVTPASLVKQQAEQRWSEKQPYYGPGGSGPDIAMPSPHPYMPGGMIPSRPPTAMTAGRVGFADSVSQHVRRLPATPNARSMSMRSRTPRGDMGYEHDSPYTPTINPSTIEYGDEMDYRNSDNYGPEPGLETVYEESPRSRSTDRGDVPPTVARTDDDYYGSVPDHHTQEYEYDGEPTQYTSSSSHDRQYREDDRLQVVRPPSSAYGENPPDLNRNKSGSHRRSLREYLALPFLSKNLSVPYSPPRDRDYLHLDRRDPSRSWYTPAQVRPRPLPEGMVGVVPQPFAVLRAPDASSNPGFVMFQHEGPPKFYPDRDHPGASVPFIAAGGGGTRLPPPQSDAGWNRRGPPEVEYNERYTTESSDASDIPLRRGSEPSRAAPSSYFSGFRRSIGRVNGPVAYSTQTQSYRQPSVIVPPLPGPSDATRSWYPDNH
ncbi:hypothetical protein BOTBODRAFT_46163 [Botryobasidium botryosum FD-172 SS1]|uniref:Uncharacterized protein n=1 Tax=Botryobasidium botryosum (strain FD-172 SS1) TaxID=930990 RepID=A0A067MK34_BOTB1|nr:hypothetical protein BOTBODRAFT_46163 [Botryobasidium botryosum FD-172 SS1]